jgi:hypothetical protein
MNISWNAFFIFTAIGLVIYYGAVIFIFFRKKNLVAGGYSSDKAQAEPAKKQRLFTQKNQPDTQTLAGAVYIDTKVIREEDYAANTNFITDNQHEYQAVNIEDNLDLGYNVNHELEAGAAAQMAHETAAANYSNTNAEPHLQETFIPATVALDSDAAYESALQAVSVSNDTQTQPVQAQTAETVTPQLTDNSSTATTRQHTEIPEAVMQEDVRSNQREPQKLGSLMHLVNKKSFQ